MIYLVQTPFFFALLSSQVADYGVSSKENSRKIVVS